MPWAVDHDPKLAAVRLTLSGTVSIDELRKMTEEASAVARNTGSARILVDTSVLAATIPLTDIIDLARFYSESGVDRRFRVAVIMPAIPELHEDMRFYETVCRNRGFDVTAFSTRDEAMAWLEE